MDYEKLHKDTIAKLQEMVNSGKITVETALGICVDFVPESEDERIRKRIIQALHGDVLDMKEIAKALAWLEKQGEHSPVVIIPKFRVGDNIKTTNEEPLTITKIDDKGYWSEDLFICGFDDAAKWELVEQKPAWSEEDELNMQGIIDLLPGLTIRHNWLKSLKDRVQPKQEWSEEDEQYLLVCKNALRKYQVTDKWDSNIISQWLDNKLKSLRPQSTWKPSDEQIEILEHFVRSIGESGYASPYDNNTKLLYSLLSDLKKLKG